MSRKDECGCSRRSFLHGAGLTLAGFGVSSLFPGAWIRHAMAGGPFNGKRLLFIFLRGGNDGLNTVLPLGDGVSSNGDPDYNTTNRPTLFIPRASTLDLGNGFARLHPSLADLLPVHQSGDLAVIHRVGFPNNTRSHFDDQRIWENGAPATPKSFEGWLFRYIQENAVAQGYNLPALSVQATRPVLLRGDEPVVNIANPDSFGYIFGDPKRAKFAGKWRTAYTDLAGLEPYRPVLADTGVKLIDTLDEYASWDQLDWVPKDPVRTDFNGARYSLFPVSDATNPATSATTRLFTPQSYGFFRSLKICALAMLESDGLNQNGTRIAGTELGNFDTHNSQGQTTGTQAQLLSWLAYGIRSLQVVLSSAAVYDANPRTYPNIWADTAVVTLSEFGRTSKENGSIGTDHAAASCLFVAGGAVNGGVYNCDASSASWPAGVMLAVNGRYLSHKTDFRALFWEILRDHMGASPSSADAVFPGYTGLGLQELNLFT